MCDRLSLPQQAVWYGRARTRGPAPNPCPSLPSSPYMQALIPRQSSLAPTAAVHMPRRPMHPAHAPPMPPMPPVPPPHFQSSPHGMQMVHPPPPPLPPPPTTRPSAVGASYDEKTHEKYKACLKYVHALRQVWSPPGPGSSGRLPPGRDGTWLAAPCASDTQFPQECGMPHVPGATSPSCSPLLHVGSAQQGGGGGLRHTGETLAHRRPVGHLLDGGRGGHRWGAVLVRLVVGRRWKECFCCCCRHVV